jgi:2-dehydro-3-deoxygluconokinase
VSVDLLCMGEPMLEFSQLPVGADGVQHYLEGFGGDTSNAAVAAARQGASVGYVSALGVDMPGDRFMALWAREGVDTSCVLRTDRYQTGVYFVTHDAAGHHFLHYRTGSAASMYSVADVAAAAIAAARILYVSGISQGISAAACDAVFAAIEVASRHGVSVAYDTNYRPRLWPPARAAAVMHEAMRSVTYALPGLDDVQVLTGFRSRCDAGFLPAARPEGGGAADGRGGGLSGDPEPAGADSGLSGRCGRCDRGRGCVLWIVSGTYFGGG